MMNNAEPIVLNYKGVVAAACKAYDAGKLQATHAPDDQVATGCCYYKNGFMCAVGAALPEDHPNTAIIRKRLNYSVTHQLVDDELIKFDSYEDQLNTRLLQAKHDQAAMRCNGQTLETFVQFLQQENVRLSNAS